MTTLTGVPDSQALRGLPLFLNMTNALERQPHDLGVHSVPPTRPTDPRVRLAEEDSLQAWISAWADSQNRQPEWVSPVALSVDSNRLVTVTGKYRSRNYPDEINLNTTFTVPALDSSGALVRQEDRLYLVVFGAIADQAHDTALGQINFQYLNRTDPQNPVLTPVTKENAKRDRAFWILVLTGSELTADTFNAALPQEAINVQQSARLTGDRYLRILNTTDVGFPGGSTGNLRIFARDPNLVQADYPILKDFVDVAEIGRVLRIQNHTDRGYTWGRNGEEPLSNRYNILRLAAPKEPDLDTRARNRLAEVCAGVPGAGLAYSRTIQNLTAGLVAGNPGRAGESAAAPNGSVCLANDDRVTFTNQKILQKIGVQVATATNDGSGNAVVIATLNGNSPSGTRFSEKPSDHRIYRPDGTEHAALGQFINLGGTGSLVWIGTQNSSIRPGNECFFVPAIETPAGSGFSVPFDTVEQAWYNGTPIASSNIRIGSGQDLDSYEAPQGSDPYIAVLGRERAALHYLYKRITFSSDANGVGVIPSTERGCFAFISGVSGRIDAPVATGLVPNTTYNALIYYPPRSAESWQFQFSYCPYQGTAETDFLNGSIVISAAYGFLNTQGGGTSVYQGEGKTRYSPISMHLPSTDDGQQSYVLNAPVALVGEPRPGPVTFREVPPLPGAGIILPAPGTVLQVVNRVGINNGRTLNIALMSNGQPVGFRSHVLNKRFSYQAVLAFVVRKGSQERLVIATKIGTGAENIPLDAQAGAAIDTFRL